MDLDFLDTLNDVGDALSRRSSARSVQKIALSRISSDPNNPRTTFDQAALEEMAGSIKERGVLQPITLRTLDAGKTYVVRYGDRRFRAAKLAGLTDIPAIVTEADADENDLLDQVIENDQRVDLSTGDMARSVTRMTKQGLSQTEISKRLGRPQSTIAQLGTVAAMVPALQEFVDRVGIRTLYDLHQTWTKDAPAVEEFLASTSVEDITRASVKAIGSSAKMPETRSSELELPKTEEVEKQGSAASSEGKTPAAKSEQEQEREPARTSQPKNESAPSEVIVCVDGRRARLVFPSSVRLIFEGEDQAVSVSADRVQPV